MYTHTHVPLENPNTTETQELHQLNKVFQTNHSSLLPITLFLAPVSLHYQTFNTTTKGNHLSMLTRLAVSRLKLAFPLVD